MKPLTRQCATGYSLSLLPHSASVTKLSLRPCTKACEAPTFPFHQPAQTGDGKMDHPPGEHALQALSLFPYRSCA